MHFVPLVIFVTGAFAALWQGDILRFSRSDCQSAGDKDHQRYKFGNQGRNHLPMSRSVAGLTSAAIIA